MGLYMRFFIAFALLLGGVLPHFQLLFSQQNEISDSRQTISFQGFLTQDDISKNTSVEITFSLYENNLSGRALWNEKHLITPDKGLFTVE